MPNGQQNSNKVIAAQNVCYGSIFSGFLGNRNAYAKEAGFNINTAGGQFPYGIAGSTEQGADTDNYGSYGTLFGGNDFGPCSRIGGFAPANQTINATLAGNTITFLPGAPRTAPAVGDTVFATNSSGQVVYSVITNLTTSQAVLFA